MNNAAAKRNSSNYNTDTTSEQIKINNYRVNVFKFLPITKQLARVVMTIFACSNVNIMGIDFICENIEMDPLGDSNLYVITATMQEKGSGINRQSVGTTSQTLPELIVTENGYIKL